MSKKKKLVPADEPFFCNITIRELFEVVKLATGKDYDWSIYDPNRLIWSVKQNRPSIHNDFSSDTFALVELPFLSKNGKYGEFGFEVKFFEDGFVSYENGSDVKMRVSNPLKVYELMLKYMNR